MINGKILRFLEYGHPGFGGFFDFVTVRDLIQSPGPDVPGEEIDGLQAAAF